MSLHQICRFLDLPLEIRRKIYHLALPSQNTPPQSALWSSITDVPNHCMSLLLTNHEISAEAREVMYSVNTFTVAVSSLQITFLYHSQLLQNFRPFKPRAPIHHIKKWQFDLQFDSSYRDLPGAASMLAPHLGSTIEYDQYYIREGVLGTILVMAEQSTDLQRLKIRVPCLCQKRETTTVCKAQSAIRRSLEPLTLLKFRGGVTLIAARHEDARHGRVLERWKMADTQCQEGACLAFADSFADVEDVIGNQNVPPLLLSPREKQCMDLKQRTAELLPEINPQIRCRLLGVWAAMETHTDAEFKTKVDKATEWIKYRSERKYLR